MSVGRELVETAEGHGRLSIGGDSYPTSYYVEITQDVHTYTAGGVEKTLPGVRDFTGNLVLEEALPIHKDGPATLTMQDGRRLEIILPPRSHAATRVAFLGNGNPKD